MVREDKFMLGWQKVECLGLEAWLGMFSNFHIVHKRMSITTVSGAYFSDSPIPVLYR